MEKGAAQDDLRYLKMSRGALFELETQLLFARDLSYISQEKHEALAEQTNDVARVLAGPIRSLEGEQG